MGRILRGKVLRYTVPVHLAHPISVGMSNSLGYQTGLGINGSRGTIRYGFPSVQTQYTNFKGYAAPPQMFLGWNPRKVAGGAIQTRNAELPSTSAPQGTYTPIERALAAVTNARGNLSGQR